MSISKSSSDFGRSSSDDRKSKIKSSKATSKLLELLEDKDILDSEAWIKAFDTPMDFYCFYSTKLQTIIHETTKAERFLTECKATMDKVDNMKDEILERDLQLFNLQNDVTDLKCTLLQERTNYQSLLREHELIKLEKEDYYRKFNAALLLGGVTERDVGFLMQNNPKSSALLNKIGEVKDEIAYYKASSHEQDNPLVLRKKIEILESQIKSLETARRGDSDDFHKTLEFLKEEQKVAQKRFTIEIQKAAEEIRDVKALSYCLMKSKMDLLKKVISSEEEHLETKVELAELKQKCDFELFEIGSYSKPMMDKPTEKRPDCVKLDLERTKNLLAEKENIIKEYELKFCCMEKEYRRFKEIHSVSQQQYEGNKDKLYKRIKVLEQRCEKDDQRRKLENSGFHQDIRSLRQFLTTLEKRVNSTIMKQSAENIPVKQDNVVWTRRPCNNPKSGNVNLKVEKLLTNGVKSKPLDQESMNQLFRMASARLAEIEGKIKGTNVN